MKERIITKFNLYMSCVLLVVIVLIFLGVTMAYFTDTVQSTSTFVSGNVKLTLSEAAVKADTHGNLVEDTEKPRIFGALEETVIHNYGKIYPGQTAVKDPTITNTGNTPEWVAAKVTLTDGTGDLTKVMGYENYDGIDLEILLSGGLLADEIHFGDWNGIPNVRHNDHYALIQVPDASSGKFTFYFLMLKPLDVGKSVMIFDKITFPQDWNNKEMKELADLKINVQAFGVQTSQMESCLDAMTTAFPEHFNF